MFAYQKVANQSKFIVLNGTIWYYSLKCLSAYLFPIISKFAINTQKSQEKIAKNKSFFFCDFCVWICDFPCDFGKSWYRLNKIASVPSFFASGALPSPTRPPARFAHLPTLLILIFASDCRLRRLKKSQINTQKSQKIIANSQEFLRFSIIFRICEIAKILAKKKVCAWGANTCPSMPAVSQDDVRPVQESGATLTGS